VGDDFPGVALHSTPGYILEPAGVLKQRLLTCASRSEGMHGSDGWRRVSRYRPRYRALPGRNDHLSQGEREQEARIGSGESRVGVCAWVITKQEDPASWHPEGRWSGDRDGLVEVDVLNSVEQRHAVFHGLLERLASGDEADTAGAFVDDGGCHSIVEVGCALGFAAGVEEGGAAGVAVDDLVAAEVDGVAAGAVFVAACEGGVDAFVELAVGAAAGVEGGVSAVLGGELLLDDVGLDGDAEVIALAGEVGGGVVVDGLAVGAFDLKGVVADVAPEDGDHAVGVGFFEPCGDFVDLAGGLVGAEVDGGSDAGGAHFEGLADAAVAGFVGLVGVGEKLVVIELDHEGDLVGVLAGD